MHKKIKNLEKAYIKNISQFNVGDTIQVYLKIKEEGKSRIQMFEGVVIRKQGSGASKVFTVRRISYGEGVERTFPMHSPNIDSIKVVKKGKVKRAKLYYLRKKVGKKTKVEEKESLSPESTSENVLPRKDSAKERA